MRKERGKRKHAGRFGALLTLVAVALPLGACSTAGYKKMPPDLAWHRMEQDKIAGRNTGMGIEIVTGRKVNLTDQLEEAQARATKDAVPEQALREMSDQMAQWLVTRLPEPEYKAGLIVGRLRDDEANPELQSVLDSLAIKLIQNETFSQRFAVHKSTASESEAILEEVSGPAAGWLEPLEGNYDLVALDRPHPDDVYLLTGSLRIVREKDNRLLHVTATIQIEKPREGGVIIGDEFKRSYYYHPALLERVSQDEGERLYYDWTAKRPADLKHCTHWWE